MAVQDAQWSCDVPAPCGRDAEIQGLSSCRFPPTSPHPGQEAEAGTALSSQHNAWGQAGSLREGTVCSAS